MAVIDLSQLPAPPTGAFGGAAANLPARLTSPSSDAPATLGTPADGVSADLGQQASGDVVQRTNIVGADEKGPHVTLFDDADKDKTQSQKWVADEALKLSDETAEGRRGEAEAGARHCSDEAEEGRVDQRSAAHAG